MAATNTNPTAVIVGLGEVGRPLLDLVRRAGVAVVGIDVAPAELPPRGSVDVMHVCFPFEVPDFVGEVSRYAELLEPRLTVIDSTVAVGTTRAVHARTGGAIVHSPVRGKHARMLDDMSRYAKFVGGIDDAATAAAEEHFTALGLTTRALSCPEATELAKLTETTYFGILIAWAQEVDRYCRLVGADYDEVASFYEEIAFLPPVKYFPGVIGGHCVMPNIEILRGLDESVLLEAVRASNERRAELAGVLEAAQ